MVFKTRKSYTVMSLFTLPFTEMLSNFPSCISCFSFEALCNYFLLLSSQKLAAHFCYPPPAGKTSHVPSPAFLPFHFSLSLKRNVALSLLFLLSCTLHFGGVGLVGNGRYSRIREYEFSPECFVCLKQWLLHQCSYIHSWHNPSNLYSLDFNNKGA